MTVFTENLRAGPVDMDLIERGTKPLDPVHSGKILRDCLDDLGMFA